jgi:hypothetical protein
LKFNQKLIPWIQAFGFFLNDNALPISYKIEAKLYKVLPEIRSAC